MGIKGLMPLIADVCPAAIKESKIENYFSRIIAIDATMSIYQFLISMKGTGMDLTNEKGEVTSHLQGLLFRTTKLMLQGIKPIYVFDGKPPEMKVEELKKRKERVKKAENEIEEENEQEVGVADKEKIISLTKRTVRVTKEQMQEAKDLLKLMGVPVIESPTEAEAQCCEIAKKGLAYAVGSEDADVLTFGAPIVLRHLTYSDSKKKKNPIQEVHLDAVLEGLGVTMDQFVDICILCGCDYCETIKGVGAKKAYQMIKEYKNIEGVIKHLEAHNREKGKQVYGIPESFPYQQARELLKNPEITPAENIPKEDLQQKAPKEQELLDFLVKDRQFDEKKVHTAIDRIKTSMAKKPQTRIDNFFKITGQSSSVQEKKKEKGKKGAKKGATGKAKTPAASSKRKRENDDEGDKKKKRKTE